MNDNLYIDVEEGLARVRGNKSLYIKMLNMLLNSKEFDAFEISLANNDYEEAGNVAHGIKGMTGNLSLSLLFKYSTELMNQLRNGAPNEDTVAVYRETFINTKKAVQEYIEQNS